MVSVAVEGSLDGTGFSGDRGFIGLYRFQWRYRVHCLVLVSMAVEGSLVGTGFSGGTGFIAWNSCQWR